MTNDRQPLFEQVAQRLIEQLEKGTSPFQKPWEDSRDMDFDLPMNATTGKNYRGLNSIWLMMQGFEDPRWLTFKQAAANGWSVERGSKGTLINYVKLMGERVLRDEKGRPLLDEDGITRKQRFRLDRPIITSAIVFNAAQVRGIPERVLPEEKERSWDEVQRASQLVKNSGATIRHGGNQAYYSPMSDSITVPAKKQFAEASRYYAVLLHELGHWTGHASRLNRPMVTSFGTEEYAKEELRSEIASLMLGSKLKLGHDFGQHASYVESWIGVLKNDPFELYRASADAQKIMDYILQFETKRAEEISSSEKQSISFPRETTIDTNAVSLAMEIPPENQFNHHLKR